MDKVGRKRERLEIIYDLLVVIRNRNNSIKPTPLMRYANLSTKAFSEYVSELKSKDFVKELCDKKQRKYFTLTDKGFEYLESYKRIQGFIEEFNL